MTPRFNKIDQKLAKHDVMLEAIIFVSDKHTKQIEKLQVDVDELKTDVKIIKTDIQALKFGQQSDELRFIKLEKKIFAV